MQPDPYRIILRPIITEKSAALQQAQNSYLFEVAIKANKIQIRQALESIYKDKKIEVESVRTARVKGKFRRVRIQGGYTNDWKKAHVTLKKGQTLELA